jgi:uncharacterized membrane protein
MKSSRKPALILQFLCAAFLTYLIVSSNQLPERVATHFDMDGKPNGWMSRSSLLVLSITLGIGLPLGALLLFFGSRFLPKAFLNIPNRDYWLEDSRRQETFSYLSRQSLWLNSILVCFLMGIHFLVVQANLSPQKHLSTPVLFTFCGLFLVAIGIWVGSIFRHFNKTG